MKTHTIFLYGLLVIVIGLSGCLSLKIPDVTPQYSTYTAENLTRYPIYPRVAPSPCGEWAISPITVNIPGNGVIQEVSVNALVGYTTYASDVKIYLANDTMQQTIFEGMGHYSGHDGGDDDDPENDWDLDFRNRTYPIFINQLVNQEWKLLARICSSYNQGNIISWSITFKYAVGSEIDVLPKNLVFYQDVSTVKQEPMPILTQNNIMAQGGEMRVVVTTKKDAIQAFSNSSEVEVVQTLNSGFAAIISPEGLSQLMNNSNVLNIVPDVRVHTSLKQGTALINADDAWDLGYTGDGVSVAIIDTGIDVDHLELKDDLLAQKCYAYKGCPPNNSNSGNYADDGAGHGSAVAGIVSSDGRHNLSISFGVAPDAGLVICKSLSDDGSGYMSDSQACIEWVTSVAKKYNVRAINMSLGGGGLYNRACDNLMPSFTKAVEDARKAGITVLAASGNEFSTSGISMPACVSGVVSVGAVFDAGSGDLAYCPDSPGTAPDKVICYSNAGINLDLLAPSYKARTANHLGGVWPDFGGTSAASPYAAGVVALMAQANPYLTPDQIRDQLKATGKPIVDWRNGKVFPRVDALAAITKTGVSIRNVGSQTLHILGVDVKNSSCWLTLGTVPIDVAPLTSTYLPVTTNKCVSEGHYADVIVIRTDDAENPVVYVPVDLYVVGDTPIPTVVPTDFPTPTVGPSAIPTETPTELPTYTPTEAIPTATFTEVPPTATPTKTGIPTEPPEITPIPTCSFCCN